MGELISHGGNLIWRERVAPIGLIPWIGLDSIYISHGRPVISRTPQPPMLQQAADFEADIA